MIYFQAIDIPWYPILGLAQPLAVTDPLQAISAGLYETKLVKHEGFKTTMKTKQWLPQFNV